MHLQKRGVTICFSIERALSIRYTFRCVREDEVVNVGVRNFNCENKQIAQ